MSESEKNKLSSEDSRIRKLRDSIRRAFPDDLFTGKITVSDDHLGDPELDEEKELYENLYGHRWTEISSNLLNIQASGFMILTDAAFPTFLAAWLMYALDNGGENRVREALIFSFSNSMRQFRVLNAEQQTVVRELMEEFVLSSTSAFDRKTATEAVALIDRKRY